MPDSPSSITVALVAATFSTVAQTFSICGSRVRISPSAPGLRVALSRRFSACSSCSRKARSIISESSSGWKGLE